ncbi:MULTISPECIES: hypothetical protein [Dyella]|uniref:Uncharacterized protein n=2 Tax=Dyella TaxID=231454 RepID=A0A4R0Z171_9GAMM|nr:MULTISPECIES: hypothetical protein [Dyella]TBR40417.1 hypothetical protein EYV96_09745 [Dyella terrae]TCI12000.1 hypothetical protein EZM97_01125 [Dyella soli]
MNWTAVVFWLIVIGFIVAASVANAARRKIKDDKVRMRVRLAWIVFWSLFGLLFVGSVIYGVNSFAELDSSR